MAKTKHYSQDERVEILGELVEAISEGIPLAEFARQKGVGRTTLYTWLNDNQLVSEHIARAREVGYDALAAEIIDILDNCAETSEGVAKAKAQAWGRLQLLSKWHKTKYGDQQRLEHVGDPSLPVTIVTGVPQPEPPKPKTDDIDLSFFGG